MSDSDFKQLGKNKRVACSCEEEEWAIGEGERSIRNWERVREVRASASSPDEAAATLAAQGIESSRFSLTDVERRLMANGVETDRLAAQKVGALIVVTTAAGFGGLD